MESLVEWAKALWGLWLMLIFLGIVASVMWPGRKRQMDEHARIPFEDPLDDSERKRNGRQD
jgi:cbb3-type cytochrome oxidase subunit 3